MTEKRDIIIRAWADLRPFGINMLTGESCAFSMRLLCDVSEEGRVLLGEWLGMPDIHLAAPWNSRVGDAPSVGSIMLDRSALHSLGRFILAREGVLAIAEYADQSLVGITTSERLSQYEALSSDFDSVKLWRNACSSAPVVGSRNVHALTGRAA